MKNLMINLKNHLIQRLIYLGLCYWEYCAATCSNICIANAPFFLRNLRTWRIWLKIWKIILFHNLYILDCIIENIRGQLDVDHKRLHCECATFSSKFTYLKNLMKNLKNDLIQRLIYLTLYYWEYCAATCSNIALRTRHFFLEIYVPEELE